MLIFDNLDLCKAFDLQMGQTSKRPFTEDEMFRFPANKVFRFSKAVIQFTFYVSESYPSVKIIFL